MNRWIVLMTAGLLACAACKGEQREDGEPTEAPATATQTTAAPATAAQEPEEPQPEEEDELKDFGELVEGFQAATVTMNEKFPGPVKIEGKLDWTADHVSKLVEAVGSDTMPTAGKPKCPMSYTFTFHGEEEDTVLSGVCSGGEDADVILVWDNVSYQAANPAAVFEMLKAK